MFSQNRKTLYRASNDTLQLIYLAYKPNLELIHYVSKALYYYYVYDNSIPFRLTVYVYIEPTVEKKSAANINNQNIEWY